MQKKHKKLKIISYDDFNQHKPSYLERLNSTSTIVTDLNIYPFSPQKQSRVLEQQYPLFVTVIPDMIPLIEEIYSNSKKLESIGMMLPGIANEKLLINLMIEEIQSTNEIEGVKSTRSEINEAFEAKNKKKVRFGGIVHLYYSMIENEKIEVSKLDDFREIYDRLVLEEIDEEDNPDGELFRVGPVYIKQGDKKYHQGDPNESIINENLLKLIKFMNLDNISYLFKSVVTHYFFEYIHPFYDGNGRMGRFLLSRYLARKIDVYTGMSFSQGVAINKTLYENSFSEVSHPKNNGELTYFVIDMMKIIIQGQKKIIKEMKILQKQLDNAHSYIEKHGWDEKKAEILFIFFQDSFYSAFDYGLTNITLHDSLSTKGFSRYRINKITSELEEEEFIKKIGQRPIKYVLRDEIAALFE